MFHVGLDIHTQRISICALDEKGQVVLRSQVRGIQDLVRILTDLPDRFEVCYEASCGYGHFHDLLRLLATRVLVAHPGQLRLIFPSKDNNDRNDAERLVRGHPGQYFWPHHCRKHQPAPKKARRAA
jgi:hypothetical protein